MGFLFPTKNPTSLGSVRASRRNLAYCSNIDWVNATQVTSGSGNYSSSGAWIHNDSLKSRLGATALSSVGAYKTLRFPQSGASGRINWAKKMWFAFQILLDVGGSGLYTGCIFRVHVTQATTIVDLAAHGLGIEIDATPNISLVSYGTGGSEATVSGAITLVTGNTYAILLEHDPAVADRLYVGGVLKATQSTAASIPSTEPATAYNIFHSSIRTGEDTTNNLFELDNFEAGVAL